VNFREFDTVILEERFGVHTGDLVELTQVARETFDALKIDREFFPALVVDVGFHDARGFDGSTSREPCATALCADGQLRHYVLPSDILVVVGRRE